MGCDCCSVPLTLENTAEWLGIENRAANVCLPLLTVVDFLAGCACCSSGVPHNGTSPGPRCLARLLVEMPR